MSALAPRIEVVSAIIIRDGKLLLQQRSASRDFPGKWETPGGKIDLRESVNAALRREIREELGVESHIGDFICAWSFDPPVVAAPLRIRFYRVSVFDHEPRCMDAMGLGWFDRAAVLALDMTPGTAKFRHELTALLPERIASIGELAVAAANRATIIDGALRACLVSGPKNWVQLTKAVTDVVGGYTNADEFDAALSRVGGRWDRDGVCCSLPLSGVSL